MAATPFGLGTPLAAPAQSPIPQVFGQSPFSLTQVGALNPYAAHPLHQIQQLLQIVPQQLHHLAQLEYLQHYQLQQLQQILQFIPAQLAQVQQLVQGVPQHLQQIQQPFGTAGLTFGAPWGMSPHMLGAQPGYVM